MVDLRHYHYFNQKLRKIESDAKLSPILDSNDDLQDHLQASFACYDHGDCCTARSHGAKPSEFMLIRFFLLLVFVSFSFCFILIHRNFVLDPSFHVIVDAGGATELRREEEVRWTQPAPCSSVANNSICCDRTAFRSDVCFMRGDLRTHSATSSVLLMAENSSRAIMAEEKIRPYTRKWETGVMNTIDELSLRATDRAARHRCDVRHDVPALVFSAGGYTGNVYHEFNDGIIPLYITSQHFKKKVVFVVLEYHDWWIAKYGEIISLLSDHPPIDFSNDRRTHCFSEAIVGLRIHDELAVDAARMVNNKTIVDFHGLLAEAYNYKPRSAIDLQRPKLVIMSRRGSRSIENEAALIKSARKLGFQVKLLRPDSKMELSKIFEVVSGCDVMVGVHGAAMTHLLFMRPGTVLIQIVPLGTDWAAEAYYGQPAAKFGLLYMAYKVSPAESSLYRKYGGDHPVVRDPESVNAKGWKFTKKIYLERQNVRLNVGRFEKKLEEARRFLISRKGSRVHRRRPTSSYVDTRDKVV